jgi:hypothetical protein
MITYFFIAPNGLLLGGHQLPLAYDFFETTGLYS